MKTAVVYFSLNGNTAFAAEKIAALLGADCYPIRTEVPYPDRGLAKFFHGGKSAVFCETPKILPCSFRPEEYNRVIFGFPVWAGNLTPPIRSFIKEYKSALEGKLFAAFACQSGAGGEKALGRLSACLGAELSACLVLNDPKTKPSPENEEKIRGFAKACR